MIDSHINIRFITDSPRIIEKVLRVYAGRGGPITDEQVRDNGGPPNLRQIYRIGSFLQDIGVLEQPLGMAGRKLTTIGISLAQALDGKDGLDPKKCWQMVMVKSPEMKKLLVQIRRRSYLPLGKMIEHIESIIETNLEHYGRRMDSRSLNQAARTSLYNLMYENDMVKLSKSGRIIINAEVLYRSDWGEELGVTRLMPPHIPRGDLFSLDITKGTQPYIESMAKQANGSFEQGWYDACAVMVRRLLETLIIECYEYHEIADSIKGSDGNFLYLGGLISRFLGENKWNINRNARAALSNLPKLKGIGDLSAHNRGFNAGLKDIRDIQTELRIVIEEMVRIAGFGRTTSAST